MKRKTIRKEIIEEFDDTGKLKSRTTIEETEEEDDEDDRDSRRSSKKEKEGVYYEYE